VQRRELQMQMPPTVGHLWISPLMSSSTRLWRMHAAWLW
jgi:hypothetical protein